tara:strand:+ start:1079 stop:1489 length:411 start_codon:yes stop_codon:yes gene_type:complete
MTYTRIYDNVYTFPVYAKELINPNAKYFFDPCPEIKKRQINAISISYYNYYNGYIDSAYITLKNGKNDIICYHYPATDLMDTTTQNTVLSGSLNYKLRLFKIYDLDLNSSFYMYNHVALPFPTNGRPLFNLNFYLD